MKKIVTSEQKKEVRGYINKWRPKLFLNQWVFTVNYFGEDTEISLLQVEMSSEYKRASINMNTSRFFDCDKWEREQAIVHEMSHAIIQQLMWLIDQAASGRQITGSEFDWHKESVTQHIANIAFHMN